MPMEEKWKLDCWKHYSLQTSDMFLRPLKLPYFFLFVILNLIRSIINYVCKSLRTTEAIIQKPEVLIQFLLFIQLGLRTQPSCRTWTPWICCRFRLGLRRVSSTAAWWFCHIEPRWICQGPQATCAAWPLFVSALAPLTPSHWRTFLTHSRWTAINCSRPLLLLVLPETMATCSWNPNTQLCLT